MVCLACLKRWLKPLLWTSGHTWKGQNSNGLSMQGLATQPTLPLIMRLAARLSRPAYSFCSGGWIVPFHSKFMTTKRTPFRLQQFKQSNTGQRWRV